MLIGKIELHDLLSFGPDTPPLEMRALNGSDRPERFGQIEPYRGYRNTTVSFNKRICLDVRFSVDLGFCWQFRYWIGRGRA